MKNNKRNRLPFMKVFAFDDLGNFVLATASLAAQGLYQRLKLLLWTRDGVLPNDPKKLGKFCAISPKKFSKLFAEIESEFEVTESEIRHPEITKQLEECREISRKASDAGKKSAFKRANPR